MASPRNELKATLIVGLLAGDIGLFPKVKMALERMFGGVGYESGLMEFAHTDYYKEEMGDNLKKKFFSFERLFNMGGMHKIKIRTNALETKFSKNGKRTVNIDPGYLDLSKVVLLSTKDYSHRVYLNEGIFAEATLFCKDNTFNPWPWTYPDYKTKEYIGIFNIIRNRHKEKRRSP